MSNLTLLESDLQIVSIDTEDIPGVVELLRANGMNYGSVEFYREYFYKVQMDRRMVGCVAVIPRTGFSEIKSLLVDQEYRSFKVFNKISDFVTLKSLEHDRPCVVVKVSKHNPAVLLYRRKRFKPLTVSEYPEIYGSLKQDCVACHAIVKNICNPTYLVIDTRKTPYDIEEWKNKVEAGTE